MSELIMPSGYGANLEHDLKNADINISADKIDAFKLAIAAEEMDANSGWKNSENKKVQANGYTVIFTKYPRNPYRVYYKSNSGLITNIGSEGNQFYRSMETGEIEEAELGVICCNVVSVGPECKYVKEGDDIYLRNVGLAPVPFAGKGYWAVSEQNVICRVVPEDFKYPSKE